MESVFSGDLGKCNNRHRNNNTGTGNFAMNVWCGQVTSTKEEADNLRQENETLRQRDEQFQNMVKNNRAKISFLEKQSKEASAAAQRHMKGMRRKRSSSLFNNHLFTNQL